MSNTIFSTVDSLTSRFKLVDNLINTVATRLLPRYEAKGYTCPASHPYWCGMRTCGAYCTPHYDYMQELWACSAYPGCKVGFTWYQPGNCGCKH